MIFVCLKKIGYKNCWVNKMWVKKYVGSKKFLVKKRFGSKKILVRKNFMDQKINWVKRNFWSKNFLGSKKISGQKFFWGSIDLGPIFFVLKKQVGLNQWGGCMPPPPSENSRVKILLGRSYLSKKIFCKEKNIGRVNPGKGGVDDPPSTRK